MSCHVATLKTPSNEVGVHYCMEFNVSTYRYGFRHGKNIASERGLESIARRDTLLRPAETWGLRGPITPVPQHGLNRSCEVIIVDPLAFALELRLILETDLTVWNSERLFARKRRLNVYINDVFRMRRRREKLGFGRRHTYALFKWTASLGLSDIIFQCCIETALTHWLVFILAVLRGDSQGGCCWYPTAPPGAKTIHFRPFREVHAGGYCGPH